MQSDDFIWLISCWSGAKHSPSASLWPGPLGKIWGLTKIGKTSDENAIFWIIREPMQSVWELSFLWKIYHIWSFRTVVKMMQTAIQWGGSHNFFDLQKNGKWKNRKFIFVSFEACSLQLQVSVQWKAFKTYFYMVRSTLLQLPLIRALRAKCEVWRKLYKLLMKVQTLGQ